MRIVVDNACAPAQIDKSRQAADEKGVEVSQHFRNYLETESQPDSIEPEPST